MPASSPATPSAGDKRASYGLNSPIPSSPSLPTKANPLQARIAAVLSASYSDLEISDTLQILDQRRIQNDVDTRRNLRLDLQQELIACNGSIVKDFGQVAEQLKRVGAALDHLNATCATMQSHVGTARRETAPMLSEKRSLTEQRRETDIKQKLLKAFNAHFLLSDGEQTALTSTAEPVDQDFYAALTKTRRIHSDCQVLLGSEDQTLGLEILEQSSRNLNAAFQKLFRWTQRELKTIDLENPQFSESVRKALRVLAERPALFQNCLDLFAESREQTLSDAFYAALTGSAANSSSSAAPPIKAIELSAHEPLRYVSDMLAWVHSATIGEREALHNLFISDAEEIQKSFRIGRNDQPWLQNRDVAIDAPEAAFDGKKALNDLVDRDLSGVLRQLRQRIEQTVRSHEDASLAYQVANLALFYKSIFDGFLGPESSVGGTLGPAASMATEQFKLITRDHIATLHNEIDAVPDDLTPPDFLEEALDTLKKLMKSYETSFNTQTTNEEKRAGFEPVLLEALDPYLGGCENVGKRLDRPDSLIFALNCLSATRAAIKDASYTADRVAGIDRTAAQQKEALVEDVHAWLVAESGMQELFRLVATSAANGDRADDVRKISQAEALGRQGLADAAQQLDAFLPTSFEDARAFVDRLLDKAAAREVCEAAAEEWIRGFAALEGLLGAVDGLALEGKNDEDEEPELLRDVFPRTTEEIRVLLS